MSTTLFGPKVVKGPKENQKPDGAEKPLDDDDTVKPWEPGYGKVVVTPGKHIIEPTWIEVNIPEAYEEYCHHAYGRSDAEFVREQYEKDYPIVNPDGETEHSRRGMPDGHDSQGNPTYQNGVPPGVKLEMMHSSLVLPPKTKASYTYSYTPGHEPWKQRAVEPGAAKSDHPEVVAREDPTGKEDSKSCPITGGLGYGLVSWPPKHKPKPYEYHYTEGDEWQQAGDTCAAKRRCGGGSSHNQNPDNGAGHSSTQSQINAKFN